MDTPSHGTANTNTDRIPPHLFFSTDSLQAQCLLCAIITDEKLYGYTQV